MRAGLFSVCSMLQCRPLQKVENTMSNFEALTYELDGAVAIITLNRPESLNSLNKTLRRELVEAMQQADVDTNVRVIMLAGNGKGFCAGADLQEMLPPSEENGFVTRLIHREYNPILQSITKNTKPVISVVQGAAAGIGGAIAMACDLSVMAENAFLYSAFGAISLIPDGGTHKFLQSAMGSKKAYEMIAFSQRLPAVDCERWGLVNRVVPAQELLENAKAWAQELAEKAPLTLSLSKKIIQESQTATLDQIMEREAQVQNITFLSEDFREGGSAFTEKRKPEFKGR